MRGLGISYGKNRHAKTWSNKTISFDDLCHRLEKTVRTSETAAEYQNMNKDDRDNVKDHGGFVGGVLENGSRKLDAVKLRSMLTLDADSAPADFIEEYCRKAKYASCIYTTHSHAPENVRVRIIVPLSRDITAEEYVYLSRCYAKEWNIDYFDPCSYKANQLMYWPTTSSDGEYIFRRTEGEWLNPDLVRDDVPKRKQQDPLEKKGIVGAFCKVHSISDVMENILSDVYRPSSNVSGRYDYIKGESTAGVVVYDGKFVYSHHATDPAGRRLLNAFDLVRIHRFDGSYEAMCDYAMQDEAVRKLLESDRLQDAIREFELSWDEPIPLSRETLPDFPINALPKALRDYALAVSESTQTSVDMAAVGILTVVSACMRNLYKVEGSPEWYEPTNIYSVIIADPSERKSANIVQAKKPIDEFVKEYNAAHKVEFEMSKAVKQRLENKKNALLSTSKKKGQDDSSNDFNDELRGVVEQLVNFEEKKPLKVYVDDTTPEKLVEILAGNNNAISIISSEGGIFDVLSGTYSNKVNIDVFLKAYSGENISVDRIMRTSLSVEDACLTILLSVQPVVIGDLMKNKRFRHRGLTARFLYTHPRTLVGKRKLNTRSMAPEVYEAYKKVIYNILREERGAEPEIIRLTDGARKYLTEYYDWAEQMMSGEFSFYGDWMGKIVGNTLRIAGIMARASVHKTDALLELDEPIFITEEVMSHAVLIGKYFMAHSISAYSKMGVYSHSQVLIKALRRMQEKNEGIICRRELMRICRWIPSADEAQMILESLEDYGYLRLIAVDDSDKIRGGRPKNPVYAVHPKAF